jgi:hypothetical protein
MISPRPAVICVLAADLAACGHMPMTSLLQLSKIDFATTDPRALRAAVVLPSGLSPQNVVLRFTGRINKGPDQTEDFRLERFSEPTLDQTLEAAAAQGSVSAYRLTAADATRLSEFRISLFRQKAAQGGSGELELTIHPEVCLTAPVAEGPVLATSYIRTSETQAYVPLARDFDLRTIDPQRDLIATAAACPSGADADGEKPL